LEVSNFVTIAFTVPATHSQRVREAMGQAGAGRIGNYSYCSFSVKGIGRFLPNPGATPYIGEVGLLEEIEEERIETVCDKALLDKVVEAIKKVHPYEETVIDIYPVYSMGRKSTFPKK
jgi:hypothetical protein